MTRNEQLGENMGKVGKLHQRLKSQKIYKLSVEEQLEESRRIIEVLMRNDIYFKTDSKGGWFIPLPILGRKEK
jgi:hypothetical protein